jgi:hypothetical protein
VTGVTTTPIPPAEIGEENTTRTTATEEKE